MQLHKAHGRPYEPRPDEIHEGRTETSKRYPDMYYEHLADAVEQVERVADAKFHIALGENVTVELHFYDDTIVRVRYGLPDFRLPLTYGLDERYAPEAITVDFAEDSKTYTWQTKRLIVSMQREDGRLSFTDRATELPFLEQAEPFRARQTINEGVNHQRTTWNTAADDVFYGLGDKSGKLDLRGAYYQNWNTDAFAYGKETDPLYRSIPFFYGLTGGGAYGFYLNNASRTHFDFDSWREGLTRIWADAGAYDFFYIHGPDLNAVAKGYHRLTGTPELPPLWALGFHQCRWSYYPASRVREVAATFREKRIPCDAIYLDIDYMDGYRCFTWNRDYFPDPPGLIKDLQKDDFHTVVMIDPGIRVDPDYKVYTKGKRKGYFCRRTTGEPMQGPVWPPNCEWPDYTHPDVRKWWGKLYEGLYKEDGISGFWNDMNEPAVFKTTRATFPDDVLHFHEGDLTDHSVLHNVYGQQMLRATHAGLRKLKKKKRPFLLGRASFAGGQRYGALWTGDNIASWEHLRLANIQCQRLSISGYSLCGTDIGGFVDMPSGELMVRWLQLGIFHPIYRVHSMGNNVDGAAEAEADEIKKSETENRLDQEPWSFGEPYTSQARAAIEFRYRLLPYLYTSVRQHVRHGQPVLRSLVFIDPTDPVARGREDEFMCGEHILVSPVYKAGQQSMQVYLPSGQWQRFTDGKGYEGRQKVRARVSNYQMAIYVRAGAVIPWYPVRQHTAGPAPETVTLRVYAGGTTTSEFYQDKGDGYDYEKKKYRRARFTTSRKKNRYRIKQKLKGNFQTNTHEYAIELLGVPNLPDQLLVDGMHISRSERDGNQVYLVPADFQQIQFDLR